MKSASDIKLIIFDVNGTLIRENSWLELNLAMGVTRQEDEMLMDWFYNDEIITYGEFQKILERIYKVRGKADYKTIKQVLGKYTLIEGAKETVRFLQDKGYKVALISGSMDILLDLIAKELEIDMYEANNIFIFDENNYLESFHTLGVDREAKYSHLLSFCRRLNISPKQCACVGDGNSDTLLFEKTGHGITFKNSGIEEKAWKVIDKLSDIKDIL